jgi:SAM-dependent methyltransferase
MANETARTDWNGVGGEAWVAEADHRDRVLAPVLDAVLGAAALTAGERVLDLGCGCGAATLAAARAVGPGGHALGVDISDTMLGVARARAAGLGVGTVDFVTADAQTHDLPADRDVAISRFGTMFFDDPVAAFANVGRSLRPGGRLAIATWQPLAENEWLTLLGDALRPFGDLPVAVPDTPGMFAQSSAGRIGDVLGAAGFTDVDVRPATVPMPLGDHARATTYLSTVGMARAVLNPLDDATRATAVRAIADRIAGDHVTLHGAILLTTAHHP